MCNHKLQFHGSDQECVEVSLRICQKPGPERPEPDFQPISDTLRAHSSRVEKSLTPTGCGHSASLSHHNRIEVTRAILRPK